MNTCHLDKGEGHLSGGIGHAGVHFEGRNYTVSGGSSCFHTQLHRLAEGAVFVDKSHFTFSDLSKAVWEAPLHSFTVEEGKIDRIGEGLLDYREGMPLGGFDRVSTSLFLAYWQKAGAKIGTRKGDEMHWSDGTVTEITRCECWVRVCLGCEKLRYYVDRVPGTFVSQPRVPEGPGDHCPACKAKGLRVTQQGGDHDLTL